MWQLLQNLLVVIKMSESVLSNQHCKPFNLRTIAGTILWVCSTEGIVDSYTYAVLWSLYVKEGVHQNLFEHCISFTSSLGRHGLQLKHWTAHEELAKCFPEECLGCWILLRGFRLENVCQLSSYDTEPIF